jgi:hypothetical protein
MILSNELQAQVDRFGRTRSCSLTSELKNELAVILKEIKGIRLNKSCGTCIRNAMQDVINHQMDNVRIEKFIGIKQEAPITEDVDLDAMSYAELKAYAGVKGNIKREKIYELIHLSK